MPTDIVYSKTILFNNFINQPIWQREENIIIRNNSLGLH